MEIKRMPIIQKPGIEQEIDTRKCTTLANNFQRECTSSRFLRNNDFVFLMLSNVTLRKNNFTQEQLCATATMRASGTRQTQHVYTDNIQLSTRLPNKKTWDARPCQGYRQRCAI
jgi:hypothetical protein